MTCIATAFAELRSAVANGTYRGPITKAASVTLPDFDDIDAMVELLGGPNAEFNNLSVSERMRVVELCNQCNVATSLAAIDKVLDNIEADTTIIADWFRNSKVYYP